MCSQQTLRGWCLFALLLYCQSARDIYPFDLSGLLATLLCGSTRGYIHSAKTYETFKLKMKIFSQKTGCISVTEITANPNFLLWTNGSRDQFAHNQLNQPYLVLAQVVSVCVCTVQSSERQTPNILNVFYVCECFALMYMCGPYAYPVLIVRRGHQIPQTWSDGQL